MDNENGWTIVTRHKKKTKPDTEEKRFMTLYNHKFHVNGLGELCIGNIFEPNIEGYKTQPFKDWMSGVRTDLHKVAPEIFYLMCKSD